MQPGMPGPLKSPLRSAAVGTNERAHVAALVLVPLQGDEEVQLVLEDRTAEGAAEVVPLERRLLLARLLQEVVGGVQLVAARVVVAAAVELVRAAAGHEVDLRAAGLAELGAVVVALDLELLDRVDRRVDEDGAVEPTSLLLAPSTIQRFEVVEPPLTETSEPPARPLSMRVEALDRRSRRAAAG